MRNRQYINPPPIFPDYIIKHYPHRVMRELMEWSKKEFHDRLIYLSEHGYWKELRRMNENWSPIRILAEMKGFRKMCAYINNEKYNQFTGRERVFIRRAYELRDLLLR